MEEVTRAVPCQLTVWGDESHLSQVYTGLSLLHDAGKIDLRQQFVSAPASNPEVPHHLRGVERFHTQLDVDGYRYYIDVHDGPEIAEVDCDFYLKRSYQQSVIPPHMTHKVRPLGLNYEVYKDQFDRFELQRRLSLSGPGSALKYVAGRFLNRRSRITVSQVAGRATARPAEPRILFMCRTWETNEPDRSPEKNAERQTINEMRAACVRALRKAFGSRFTGGFAHTAYAKKHFPDLLLPASIPVDRRSYLKTVREHEICIATMGLHGSNGWKLGEYVAQGAAIVSEQLVHEVPEFREGVNYLAFSNPEECVEAAGRLLENKAVRRRMTFANGRYYDEWLRPDRMMERALSDALLPMESQPGAGAADPAAAVRTYLHELASSSSEAGAEESNVNARRVTRLR